jgi:hypothetical protein
MALGEADLNNAIIVDEMQQKLIQKHRVQKANIHDLMMV